MPQKFSVDILERFIIALFEKIGCTNKDASIVADVLISAELRGISSHGLLRIADYINLYESNRINVSPKITIEHQTPSTAVINGDAGLGMVVAKSAMQLAIEKAENVGTGWVAVNNSNHFGIAGYYAMMALKHDMIGIALTNANPLVAPTFSVDRLLGTNPIAVAIPTNKHLPFVADFATTPIARGKLDVMHKQGKQAPLGFVQDKYGKPSQDPNILTAGGAIVPLGGDREHGSHKGYCLGAIVDILSAVLSGACFGPFVPPSVAYLPVIEAPDGKGTGHFFGAMRIDAFRDSESFKNAMDKWIETFKNAHPTEGQKKVYIPGEIEFELEKENKIHGIQLIDKVTEALQKIAEKYQIQNPF